MAQQWNTHRPSLRSTCPPPITFTSLYIFQPHLTSPHPSHHHCHLTFILTLNIPAVVQDIICGLSVLHDEASMATTGTYNVYFITLQSPKYIYNTFSYSRCTHVNDTHTRTHARTQHAHGFFSYTYSLKVITKLYMHTHTCLWFVTWK